MPSELEMLWRDRINSSIKDDLFTLYRWVHPNVQATALSYFQWLEKVYIWEQQHNTKHQQAVCPNYCKATTVEAAVPKPPQEKYDRLARE
jgi:hypothetical protein